MGLPEIFYVNSSPWSSVVSLKYSLSNEIHVYQKMSVSIQRSKQLFDGSNYDNP